MTDYEDVPDSKESWTRTTINEGLGTPGKHADEFYRHGDWGIECDSDGMYEVYVILKDRPIKVEDSLHSFEEAVQCIRAAGKDKSIGSDDSEDIKAEDGKDPEGEDTENMRDLLEEEHEAVNDYERMADESGDSHTKDVFRDIAREEKVHEGELFLLLLEKDPQQRPAMEEASEESEDMGGPSFREMLESGRAKVVSKARGERNG